LNAPFKIDLWDVGTFPSRREEDWKYTDVARVLKGPVALAPEAAVASPGPFSELDPEGFVFANGRAWDGSNQATYVTNGGVPDVIRFVTRADASGWQASVGLTVKAGQSATLLESYEGQGNGYVAYVPMRIVVEAGASLERIVIADDAAEGVTLSVAEVRIEERAKFHQTVLTSGARLQRFETHVRHPGANAEVRLDGIYLLRDGRHSDQTTVVTHAGTDGVTVQLTKGVVRDQARGVFQGRIVVEEGADRTDARMGHHALILSDRAEVDAKPELEIYADDVACAHGNTVGALDEDALFYARQRGMPEAEARALLTEAFIGEVIDRIEHDGAREVVRAWAAERLRA